MIDEFVVLFLIALQVSVSVGFLIWFFAEIMDEIRGFFRKRKTNIMKQPTF